MAAVDPVCGFKVVEEIASNDGLMAEHDYRIYYFCCEKCKREFLQDPVAALKIHNARTLNEAHRASAS